MTEESLQHQSQIFKDFLNVLIQKEINKMKLVTNVGNL